MKRSRFYLPQRHLTSCNFLRLLPFYVQDCHPGDEFKVNANVFIRTAPLAVPGFYSIQFVTRSFFIPYQSVWSQFNDFITGKSKDGNQTMKFPKIERSSLLYTVLEAHPTASTSENYDFYYKDATGTIKYYIHNEKSRYITNVLENLGYRPTAPLDFQNTYSQFEQLSALPLLCYFKAYYDHCEFAYDRDNSYIYSNILRPWYHGNSSTISATILSTAIISTWITYDNNYLTTCFDSPSGRVNGQSMPDNITFTSPSFSNTLDTTQNDGVLPMDATMNSFLHNSMKGLQSLINSLNFTGQRVQDRLKSLFNLDPKLDNLVSSVVSSSIVPLNITDVTSMASTDQDVLGSYAGKSIGQGNSNFKYSASKHGMLITMGYIKPELVNYQGESPLLVYQKSYNNWYEESKDNGVPVAVPMSQVSMTGDMEHNFRDFVTTDSVFGYQRNFAHYKYGFDTISGEFAKSLYGAWHLGRNIFKPIKTYGYTAPSALATSHDINYSTDYERIFVDSSRDTEHFYIAFENSVVAHRNMSPVDYMDDLIDNIENLNLKKNSGV